MTGFAILCLALAATTALVLLPLLTSGETPDAGPAARPPASADVSSPAAPPPKPPNPMSERRVAQLVTGSNAGAATAAMASRTAMDRTSSRPTPSTLESDIHWAAGSQPPPAARELRAALETLKSEPDHVAALRVAADAMISAGRWAMAATYLERLARARDDAASHWEHAAALMRIERWTEALAPLRRVVELQPDAIEARHNLAIAYQALGRLHEALATWTDVLARAPDHAAALAYRGEVHAELKDWAAAEADFRAALALEPQAAATRLNLATALLRLGRAADAGKLLAATDLATLRQARLDGRFVEICWELWLRDPAAGAEAATIGLSLAEELLAHDPGQPELAALIREWRAAKP